MAYSSYGSETIRELNDNDVLCGRGPGLSQFEGNLRFHKLVNARKKQYNADSANRREKKRLAQEILSHIHDKGGRFLKQVNVQDSLDTEWYEVEASVSEEKVKQALREKPSVPGKSEEKRKGEEVPMKVKRQISDDSSVFDAMNSSFESAVPFSVPPQSAASFSQDHSPSVFLPAFSPQLPSIIDPRLFLFQNALHGLKRETGAIDNLLLTNPAILSQLTNGFSNNVADVLVRLRLLQELFGDTRMDDAVSGGLQRKSVVNNAVEVSAMDTMATMQIDEDRMRDRHLTGPVLRNMDEMALSAIQELSLDSHDNVVTPSEEEVAAFLLSSCAVAGRQVISNEEEAKEKATMTDEEKAAVLVDMFGKICLDESSLRTKRPKLDLDPSSIAFLVRQMKCELERIPIHKKRALMEARSRCGDQEFSDSRLVKFLRCEGMNAELAARRFVRYWQSRRHVFGDEKYVLPMTLSGAVRDDMAALLSGVYSLLPNLDSSGRQITYLETRRNTLDGYDSRSLMRAIWYTVEVTASENTHISGGIVQCVWFAGATIWDYDKVYDQMAEYFSNCFPIKVLASHLCCPPKVITRVITPIIHSFMSKEFRARTLTHDVPESDILPVLSAYGIMPDMLPVAMGGTVVLHQAEWIATRRAIEMEEL